MAKLFHSRAKIHPVANETVRTVAGLIRKKVASSELTSLIHFYVSKLANLFRYPVRAGSPLVNPRDMARAELLHLDAHKLALGL